jgi:AraC-like DNA-binding protein
MTMTETETKSPQGAEPVREFRLPGLTTGLTFPRDQTLPSRSNTQDRLVYAGEGVITVITGQGAWVAPPERAVWLPAGMDYSVKVVATATSRSIDIDPALCLRGAPARCELISVKPLLHHLIMEAYDARDEVDSDRNRLMLNLITLEIGRAPALPVLLSFPKNPALLRLCEAFVAKPAAQQSIDVWSTRLGLSRRSFTRLFRQETGLSFTEWRRQACLFAALPRLSAGESVKTVAMDLGYSSPSAFTTMFKQMMGVSPRRYLS